VELIAVTLDCQSEKADRQGGPWQMGQSSTELRYASGGSVECSLASVVFAALVDSVQKVVPELMLAIYLTCRFSYSRQAPH